MKPKRAGLVNPILAGAFSALAACLQFSGCNGGTSTGADNPDLILRVERDGKPVDFKGFIQIFPNNSNPEFFTLPPDDGNTAPHVEIRNDPAAAIFLAGKTIAIPADLLSQQIKIPSLPLGKSSATAEAVKSIPDFNVVFYGFDNTVGLLANVHLDPATMHFSGQEGNGDTLIVRVSPEHSYSGSVDTTTEARAAVALFVPGTTFFAPVHGGDFTFEGVPDGKLPLRWVSANGHVHAMPDSLGATWTGPLRPGSRIDSIYLPPAIPTLAPPDASPLGRYAFTDSVAVTLTAQSGAEIYYTLDGIAPGPASPPYTHPIVLRVNTTIMAVAYLKGWNHSPISVNNYDLVPDLPVAAPAGKGFRDSVMVALSCKSKGASIYYTLDGSLPTDSAATQYVRPFVVKATTTVKAVVKLPGLGESRILEEKYILVTDSLAAPQP